MRRNILVAALATSVLAISALIAVAWSGATLGPMIVYRVETASGKPATAADITTTISVLERRLNCARLAGIEISPGENAGFTLTLPHDLAPRIDEIRKLTERQGTMEFRIQANSETERAERELRSAGLMEPRVGTRWVAWESHVSRPDILVETPEQSFLLAVEHLDKRGTDHDAPEYVAAKKAYEDARRNEVFTGNEVAHSRAEKFDSQFVVSFELTEDRKNPFTEFTARHVGSGFAIILDGKVSSVPVIRSALPGKGIIQGGGKAGFTSSEATALAAVLTSGSIDLRVIHVRTDSPK